MLDEREGDLCKDPSPPIESAMCVGLRRGIAGFKRTLHRYPTVGCELPVTITTLMYVAAYNSASF
jgi:hypothetical protein